MREEGQKLLGWRTVPVDATPLGATARKSMPVIRQIFIGRGPIVDRGSWFVDRQESGSIDPRSTIHDSRWDDLAFERKLYIIRRRIENVLKPSPYGPAACEEFFTRWEAGIQRKIEALNSRQRSMFYMPSLSYKTIVYKGMLNADQLPVFFPDLNDPALESALALVHSRFSTNTFPTWDRAHPYRYLAHNGEINTLRGNVNWMHGARALFAVDAVRRRHQEDPADHRPKRQRLGDVRQRPGVAGAGRPLAAARRHDDDSGAVERRRER